jgi:hypothetical protein
MGLMKMIFDGFYLISNMGTFWGQMTWFNSLITQTIVGLLMKPEDANPFQPFRDWTANIIQRRQEPPSDSKDMLNHFLEMRTVEGEPVGFPEVSIEAQNIMYDPQDTFLTTQWCRYSFPMVTLTF